MKVKSLQISNIWTFKYFENIDDAPIINFDANFNILIGQNGAGKSTVLEVINFIFKRVLLVPYGRNSDLYVGRSTIEQHQLRSILSRITNTQYFREFRLEKNYDFEDKPQKIRIVIELDAIDKGNIKLLLDNKSKLTPTLGRYSEQSAFNEGEHQNEYQIDIDLNDSNKTFESHTNKDLGFRYLADYNLFKAAIELFNEENPKDLIDNLEEAFALIGSYRNYSSYSSNASLGGGNVAERQIQQLRTGEYSKSMNASENSEPTIFSLVRLRLAGECYGLALTNKTIAQSEMTANNLEFIKAINEKLRMVSLKVNIRLTEQSTWSFEFFFIDTKRNRPIADINSLSAGQKSIIHLVFEAYGRGNLKGGLVIIDEPEIHLHHQFQNEYLRIIEKLNREQQCQYILVTHSESLISSETINSVIRLSLESNGYTKINQPNITTDQKWLVKILDYQKSTHAFFGNKVLLVEGESDKFFFRAVLSLLEEKLKRGLTQDIAVLDVGSTKDIEWRRLFRSFGLRTFFVTDFDSAQKFYGTSRVKLTTPTAITQYVSAHPDIMTRIESEYPNNTFILKEGDLELYLGIRKGPEFVMAFCQNNLNAYLRNCTDSKVVELKMILSKITDVPQADL